MAAQGSGGAFEISQRMTAAVGWGATAAFREDWVWDQAAATYALDPDMAATLRRNNPQARAGTGALCLGPFLSLTCAGGPLRRQNRQQPARARAGRGRAACPLQQRRLWSCRRRPRGGAAARAGV